MIKFIIIVTISLVSIAPLAKASDQEKIILNALFDEIGIKPTFKEEIKKRPIKKEILRPNNKPTVKQTIKPKQEIIKSKGESIIDIIKRKNRAKIKEMNKKSRFSKNEKKEDEKRGSFLERMRAKRNNSLTNLKNRTQETHLSWKKKTKETYARWKRAQQEFNKNLPLYKKTLINFDNIVTESNAPIYKKNSLKNFKTVGTLNSENYDLIKNSLNLTIRDQKRRPTCAAFATIRAIETLLAKKGHFADLSEQFFYFSSKPYCQKGPCNKRGSWPTPALTKSVNSTNFDIPLEKDCPYIGTTIFGNETQIPLKHSCLQGVVKIDSFFKLNSLYEVVESLERGQPVIGGFKLTPNFYKNSGLITFKNIKNSGKMDSHAAGHAIVFVGKIKLPSSLRNEGKFCLITANSWSEGWGKGGYACITEKWLKKQRIKNAFLTIENISYKDGF